MIAKLILRVNKALASATLKAAITGAGFQSIFGWLQPKVPKRIAK